MEKKTWIAVGAASALGLGVIAGGAVASAHELSLTSSDDTSVPGLTDVDGSTSDTSADVTFDISSDSIVSPAVVSVVSPVSVVTPAEVSAVSPVTPASPISVASPAVASVASPVSVPSAESVDDDMDSDDVDSDEELDSDD